MEHNADSIEAIAARLDSAVKRLRTMARLMRSQRIAVRVTHAKGANAAVRKVEAFYDALEMKVRQAGRK